MISTCAVGAALVAAMPSLHLGALTAVASTPRQMKYDGTVAPGEQTRFAICIPAHNEQVTIGATVEALLAQQYPASRFLVHVVADNCTDCTAALAARARATVHVRSDPEQPGKGEALNWLIHRLPVDDIDAITIVGADTVADPRFLAALDRAFRDGAGAVQGFSAVKDPGTSVATGLSYTAIACRHHLRPLARTRLGMSAGLYGNGMAFRTDLLDGRKWSNHLIEDAEFQMELLLDGETVTYVPEAVVRAGMPATFDGANSQNERWELGRLQLTGTALVSSAILVLHVLVELRMVNAPASVYRSLRSAPNAVLWKLMLLARIARRPTEVAWTRTERNQPGGGP